MCFLINQISNTSRRDRPRETHDRAVDEADGRGVGPGEHGPDPEHGGVLLAGLRGGRGEGPREGGGAEQFTREKKIILF